MKRFHSLPWVFFACLLLEGPIPALHAAIDLSGDVDPADANDWDSSRDGYVGDSGHGTLVVNDDSDLYSRHGYIGRYSDSTGEVTIDGTGSTWTNDRDLYVGYSGSGTLDITGTAVVSNPSGYIGYQHGSTGVVTVAGAGSTWTNSGRLYVGNDGSGTLDITGGGVSSSFGYIGYDTGSTGAVTVGGAGSKWTSSGDLYVGNSGSGTLDVTGGGVSNSNGYVGNNSGSTGVVTVDGAGSTWTNGFSLYVGNNGSGTLDITGGGGVSNSNGYVGNNSGSTGAVTVAGAGSTWANSGSLCVGYSGSGTLDITGGGAVSNTLGYIGLFFGPTCAVTVDGIGSKWTNSSSLYVGYYRSGTLDITGGGDVSAYSSYIGFISGSTGVATIDGAGSTWTNNYLYVGYSGSGTLDIANGATVSVSGSTYVAYETASTGLIDFGSGGGTLTTRTLFFASPTQLSGSGTIDARGLVSNLDLVFDSTHAAIQTLMLAGQPGQNITLNLDMSGGFGVAGDVGVGYRGNASLIIRDGIAVNSAWGYVGYDSNSTGVATVDGVGSTWANSSDLYVGNSGSGTLDVTGGGDVSNCLGYIGYDTGSTGAVTVDGAGSKWTSSSDLYVGNSGSGTLDVTGGGNVSNCFGYIGYDTGSTGAVTVDGAGSKWTSSSDLYVGYSGSGTLGIANGAIVSVSGSTYAAYETGSTGLIDFGSGGGTLTTRTLFFASPTQLSGSGTIDARGLVSNLDLVFDSTHAAIQTLMLAGQPGQNITLNLDLSGGFGIVGDVGVGYRGNASLIIRDGIAINSEWGYVGYDSNSTGAVTLDGAGSTWTSSSICVGYHGNGTLDITGAAVVSDRWGYIGYWLGSTGAVTVDGAGSTWTNSGGLTVGMNGRGTLDITGRGVVISRSSGYIGNKSGSTGVVTVDGAGSKWTSSSDLYVGYSGSGTLDITGGGVVSNSFGYVGWNSDATGAVTVDGAGSTWANSGTLRVGYYGSGMLDITGGGGVTARSISVYEQSLLFIDVGRGSSLTVDGGTGKIDNNGIVRILALARATPGGDYRPILAGTWTGSGVYQGVGGAWDAIGHKFIVSATESGTAGATTTIDPAVVQRLVISDDATGWSVGAGFLAADASSELNFTATPIDPATVADLAWMLDDGETVRGAWTFEIGGSGYAAGDPVYLSFDLGDGLSESDLSIWHYDGTEWTLFDAADLTYDGQYASFMVTGFSGYAVSVVPEPGTLALLLPVAMGLLLLARRRRRYRGSRPFAGVG